MMDGNALRILGICIAAALVCTALRTTHPQIAAAVGLAAGVAALMLSMEDLGSLSAAMNQLEEYASEGGIQQGYLLKVCGIALLAEFASDICRDAGEAALARRIDMGIKIGIIASALPAVMDIMQRIAELMK